MKKTHHNSAPFHPGFQSRGDAARAATTTGSTPRANAQRMIRFSFEIPDKFAPALRSAVEEMSNEIGGRLEGSYAFATETAYTDAVVALGALRAEVNAKVKAGDPNWRSR
jgi:hypothetical protein